MSTNLEVLEELTSSLININDEFNLYKEALDLLPFGVAIISSRIVTWANKRTLQLFGYDYLSEVVGENSFKFYSSTEEYERAGKACYPNGGSVLAKMKKKDGSEMWVFIRVQLSNIENGRTLAVFCGLEGLQKMCAQFGTGDCYKGDCS